MFAFGFPRNERSNIDKDEQESLKRLAAHLLSLTTQALGKAQRAGEFRGVEPRRQTLLRGLRAGACIGVPRLHAVLRPIYEKLTEGFDYPDLVRARAVLAGHG